MRCCRWFFGDKIAKPLATGCWRGGDAREAHRAGAQRPHQPLPGTPCTPCTLNPIHSTLHTQPYTLYAHNPTHPTHSTCGSSMSATTTTRQPLNPEPEPLNPSSGGAFSYERGTPVWHAQVRTNHYQATLEPYTLNPTHSTLHTQPYTLYPTHSTLHTQP